MVKLFCACDYSGSMILNQLQAIQFDIHIWSCQQVVQVVKFAGYEGFCQTGSYFTEWTKADVLRPTDVLDLLIHA